MFRTCEHLGILALTWKRVKDDDDYSAINQKFLFCNHSAVSSRKKCPYSELFSSVFSRIRTEYVEISTSQYSFRMRENADQNNSEYGRFSRSV